MNELQKATSGMERNGPHYRVIFRDDMHDRIVEGIGIFLSEQGDSYVFSWQGDPDYESFVKKDTVFEIWSTNRPTQLPHVWGGEVRML